MTNNIKIADKDTIPSILRHLRSNGVKNAWAIQDLTVWPDRSKFFYTDDNGRFSYVLLTGHPACHSHPTVIADGDPQDVAALIQATGLTDKFLFRETSADLLPVIKDQFPDSKVYLEQHMAVTAETFKPKHKGLARQVTMADSEALAQFFGAPPQAAGSFAGWINGSRAFYGVFNEGRLAAIGSSMVSVPEAWNLVSIETHKDFRRRGFGSEVTSALVERALRETGTVTVTVVKDNAPAIRTYEGIGFQYSEDCIWVDVGTGAAP
jgi:ribosomal protein S18 acetylase RimI-like enzyme